MRVPLLLIVLLLAATAFAADEKYLGLPLVAPEFRNPQPAIYNFYGVPFVQGALPLERGGTARVNVGGRVDRIFLLGMTDQISEEERTGRSKRAPSAKKSPGRQGGAGAFLISGSARMGRRRAAHPDRHAL